MSRLEGGIRRAVRPGGDGGYVSPSTGGVATGEARLRTDRLGTKPPIAVDLGHADAGLAILWRPELRGQGFTQINSSDGVIDPERANFWVVRNGSVSLSEPPAVPERQRVPGAKVRHRGWVVHVAAKAPCTFSGSIAWPARAVPGSDADSQGNTVAVIAEGAPTAQDDTYIFVQFSWFEALGTWVARVLATNVVPPRDVLEEEVPEEPADGEQKEWIEDENGDPVDPGTHSEVYPPEDIERPSSRIGRLFVLTQDNRVLVSTDGGASWTLYATGYTGGVDSVGVSGDAMVATTDNNVWVGTGGTLWNADVATSAAPRFVEKYGEHVLVGGDDASLIELRADDAWYVVDNPFGATHSLVSAAHVRADLGPDIAPEPWADSVRTGSVRESDPYSALSIKNVDVDLDALRVSLGASTWNELIVRHRLAYDSSVANRLTNGDFSDSTAVSSNIPGLNGVEGWSYYGPGSTINIEGYVSSGELVLKMLSGSKGRESYIAQNVVLGSDEQDSANAGTLNLSVGWRQRSTNTGVYGRLGLTFFTSGGSVISTSRSSYSSQTSNLVSGFDAPVPAGTARVRVELWAQEQRTVFSGSQVRFDDVMLEIGEIVGAGGSSFWSTTLTFEGPGGETAVYSYSEANAPPATDGRLDADQIQALTLDTDASTAESAPTGSFSMMYPSGWLMPASGTTFGGAYTADETVGVYWPEAEEGWIVATAIGDYAIRMPAGGWTEVESFGVDANNPRIFSNGREILVDVEDGRLLRSTDALTWSEIAVGTTGRRSIVWTGGMWVMLSSDGQIARSADGLEWSLESTLLANYDGYTWLTNASGRLWTGRFGTQDLFWSDDGGITWKAAPALGTIQQIELERL